MIRFKNDKDDIRLKILIDPSLIVDDIDEGKVAAEAIRKARKDKAYMSVKNLVKSELLTKGCEYPMNSYAFFSGYEQAIDELTNRILDEHVK